MLNLFQHLITIDHHLTNETLKQVQGDVHFMIHYGHSKNIIYQTITKITISVKIKSLKRESLNNSMFPVFRMKKRHFSSISLSQ